MTTIGGSPPPSGGQPGSPSGQLEAALQQVALIQRQMAAVFAQYQVVGTQLQQVLAQMKRHLSFRPKPDEPDYPRWEAMTAKLNAEIDRLLQQAQALAIKLGELAKELTNARFLLKSASESAAKRSASALPPKPGRLDPGLPPKPGRLDPGLPPAGWPRR